MADPIDRVFAHALQTVRRIPRAGSARPPPADRLRLYGLYKQSTEGSVEHVMARPVPRRAPRTSGQDAVPKDEAEWTLQEKAEVEKWDAWHACGHLPRRTAKRSYIITLLETLHLYANTTPESRALVKELDDLWARVRQQPGVLDESLDAAADSAAPLRSVPPISSDDDHEDHSQSIPTTPSSIRSFRSPLNVSSPFRLPPEHMAGLSAYNETDRAIMRLSAEIAALRESMESAGGLAPGSRSRSRGYGGGGGSRRSGVGGWIGWLLRILLRAIRRAAIDITLLVALFLWWRSRRGGREMWQLGLLKGRTALVELCRGLGIG